MEETPRGVLLTSGLDEAAATGRGLYEAQSEGEEPRGRQLQVEAAD
jgi:hypothetical protein